MIKINQIVDLTQPFYHNCPGPPGFSLPQVRITHCFPRDGFNMEELKFVTHTGTHIDAPYHFCEKGKKVDEIDLLSLQGRGIVIDLYNKKPKEEITIHDLSRYDTVLRKNDIVLLATGWGYKRGFTTEYIYHSPRLDVGAAKYLVKKKVRGVGIDHFSIANTNLERATPPHRTLLEAEIWILEDLFLPKELLQRESWYIVALPMLLKGGSGAPTRVIAIHFQD